jgi:hypothetical protein
VGAKENNCHPESKAEREKNAIMIRVSLATRTEGNTRNKGEMTLSRI